MKKLIDTKYEYRKGLFYHRTGENAGKPAGWKDKDGYLNIYFNGKSYRLNRFVWLYHNGDTELEVDHKDGNRLNNDISNLRLANRQQQNINRDIHTDNKSGYKGVVKYEDSFKAYTKVDGKTKYIGSFQTAEEASKAYEEYTTQLHGDFKRK